MNERPGAILARGAGKVGWRQISGPLFRKYVLLFIAVVCVALISNGILEVGFSDADRKRLADTAMAKLRDQSKNADYTNTAPRLHKQAAKVLKVKD